MCVLFSAKFVPEEKKENMCLKSVKTFPIFQLVSDSNVLLGDLGLEYCPLLLFLLFFWCLKGHAEEGWALFLPKDLLLHQIFYQLNKASALTKLGHLIGTIVLVSQRVRCVFYTHGTA